MAKTMKIFCMTGPGKVGWVEKPIPTCGPLDAICRPLALAPCSSDVHTVYATSFPVRPNAGLGHEAIGEVVEVGSLVKDFKKGDKVIVPCTTPHWGKLPSQAGFSMHCCGMLTGVEYTIMKDGVFGEFFSVNEADANLCMLPDGVDIEAACMLTDMTTTGFHGAELAEVKFGDVVCVIGIGPVGLMSVAGATLMGAGRIFAVGSRKQCCDLALEFGATDIINYKNGSITEQIMKLTNNEGVDRVIIAGGTCETFADAVRIVKPGGIIGNINYLDTGASIPLPRAEWGVGMSHKHVHGGLTPGGRLRMQKLLSLLLHKRIHPEKLITHRFEGLESIEKAFALMKDKPADVIKPIVLIKYDK